MYEFSLASRGGDPAVFLAVSLRRDVRWLGLLITMASLLTLGVAVTAALHRRRAARAGAEVLLAGHPRRRRDHRRGCLHGGRGRDRALPGGRHRRAQAPRPASPAAIAARIPDSRTPGRAWPTGSNAFVFPLWTFAVIAGAIWAENAWGRYWGWDPKETWAFITWVVYAGYLHARATAGWRGRRAAVVGLIGFACFLINFFGVNLFASGLHSYAGV